MVEDASQINVKLGEASYPGRLVALDQQHDLAVVRIDCMGLLPVALADSDSVQLAEPVRVVGYPLSNVLGNSIKVTQGSVAGLLRAEGHNLIQVNAAVNPGNSGGPLLNGSGCVIGVVNAKLAQAEISNVGFSVPSNVARGFLRSLRIPFASPLANEKLEGPELVRRVTPSVAFITISAGHGTSNRDNLLGLECSSGATVTVSGGSLPLPLSDSVVSKGSLVVDHFGRVIRSTGEPLMPSMFGPAGGSPLVQLSSRGEKTWDVQQPVVFRRDATPASPSAGAPNPFMPHSRTPDAAAVVEPAVAKSHYEVTDDAQGVKIAVLYELATLRKEGGMPLLRVYGSGTAHFDKAKGMPQGTECHVTVDTHGEGHDTHSTCTITYRPMDAAEATKLVETASSTLGHGVASLRPESLDKAIEALKSRALSPEQKYAIIEMMLKLPVDEKKQEAVADALRPLANGPTMSLSLVRALCTWGAESDLAMLAQHWESLDLTSKDLLAKRMQKLKSAEVAQSLVSGLMHSGHVPDPVLLKVLRAIGPAAESAVVIMLTNADANVRMSACSILAEIGGRAASASLSRVSKSDPVLLVRDAAKTAMRKIRSAPHEKAKKDE